MKRKRWLVALLEERSAREMLLELLPRFFGDDYASISFLPLAFEGKHDLQHNLERRIRGWQAPERTCFLVLHDQDSNDCQELADHLRRICRRAGREDTVVRIACRELESWYLGDLAAVESALGVGQVKGKQAQRKYRNPDRLNKPSQELKKLTGGVYRKIEGSRAIGKHLSLETNTSHSYGVFLAGLERCKRVLLEDDLD